MELTIISGLVLILLQIISIYTFILRLKYIREYGLAILGICLVLDLIFGLISQLLPFLFHNLTKVDSFSFSTNVLLIFQLALILLLFKQFTSIKSNILHLIFGIFVLIWSIEFYQKSSSQNLSLYTASLFSKVSIICLSWFYLLGVSKKLPHNYKEIPFLWITIGLLLYSVSYAIIENPKIMEQKELRPKDFLLVMTAILDSISLMFYIIGFWKTKNWVLKNQN